MLVLPASCRCPSCCRVHTLVFGLRSACAHRSERSLASAWLWASVWGGTMMQQCGRAPDSLLRAWPGCRHAGWALAMQQCMASSPTCRTSPCAAHDLARRWLCRCNRAVKAYNNSSTMFHAPKDGHIAWALKCLSIVACSRQGRAAHRAHGVPAGRLVCQEHERSYSRKLAGGVPMAQQPHEGPDQFWAPQGLYLGQAQGGQAAQEGGCCVPTAQTSSSLLCKPSRQYCTWWISGCQAAAGGAPGSILSYSDPGCKRRCTLHDLAVHQIPRQTTCSHINLLLSHAPPHTPSQPPYQKPQQYCSRTEHSRGATGHMEASCIGPERLDSSERPEPPSLRPQALHLEADP